MKGPHQGQPVRTAGTPVSRARAAMVMLHGRGATAEGILSLASELDAPHFAYLAPQAGGNSWWPQSFLAPIASNEPGISSAMAAVEHVLRRYGGVAALSGGLIGPDGTPRDYAGSLEGTPVFLGCSDVDSHIPAERVRLSAEVIRRLGGEVTMRLYPGMGHQIKEDEIAAVRRIMAGLSGARAHP